MKKSILASMVLFLITSLVSGCASNSDDVIRSISRGDISELKSAIKSNPALVDQWDRESRTPLLVAIERGNLDAVKFLVESGADLTKTDKKHYGQPLAYALLEEQIEIAEYLASKGAKFEQSDPHYIAARGKVKAIHFFVSKLGLDIESKDENGRTLWQRAKIGVDGKAVAEYLASHGANTNLPIENNAPKTNASYSEVAIASLDNPKKLAEVFLKRFLDDDYEGAKQATSNEPFRVIKKGTAEQAFHEYSRILNSSFAEAGKMKGIQTKITYSVSNLRKADDTHMIATYAIGTNIDSNKLYVDATLVNTNLGWRVNLESFIIDFTQKTR